MTKSRLIPATLAAGLCFVAAQAEAQDVQNFRPAPGTWNYFSVEGARTARHLELVPSLVVNYGNQPLVLRDADDEIISKLVEHLTTADLMAVIGLMDRFELALAVPMHQVSGELASDGFVMGDIRLIPKARLFGLEGDGKGFGMALSIPVSLPTGDKDGLVSADQVTVNPKLIAEGRFSGFSLAANVGYRFRPDKKNVADLEIGKEVTYGAGAAVELGNPDYVLLGEIFGSAPAEDLSGSNNKPLEALIGLRVFTSPGAVFTLGGGTGLIPDYGSPQFRVLGGFAWHQVDRDRDHDGILDQNDQCPDDPEDKDDFEDINGCPDPDNDADGILDTIDQCPNDPEDKDQFEDENGCPDPDNDNDGIPDTADQCPNDPEDKDQFEDENGCPDPDNDKDGILDVADKCPNDAEDKDQFEDEDGCPDPDNDKDGILDTVDKCPLEPEVVNNVDDDDGCPDVGKALVKVTQEKIEIMDKIYFDFNKATIQEKSFPVLDQVVTVLKRNPQIKKIRIEGHTDSKGNDNYNLELSQKRVDAVAKYLVEHGIEASRLEAKGYGETKPIDTNDTDAGRANNRRVEFTILEGPGVQGANAPAPEDKPTP